MTRAAHTTQLVGPMVWVCYWQTPGTQSLTLHTTARAAWRSCRDLVDLRHVPRPEAQAFDALLDSDLVAYTHQFHERLVQTWGPDRVHVLVMDVPLPPDYYRRTGARTPGRR